MKGNRSGPASSRSADDVEVRDVRAARGRVRIDAAGLCHSDVSVIDGTIPFPTPVVLGHEGAGIVEEVGAAVRKVKVGDHVVLTTLGNCGQCDACDRGKPTHCRDTSGKLHAPFTVGGEKAFQFANAGVFTEHTVVNETQAVVIDPDVPLAAACLIGCAVVTGVGAVLNRAKAEARRVGHGDRRRRHRPQRDPGPGAVRRAARSSRSTPTRPRRRRPASSAPPTSSRPGPMSTPFAAVKEICPTASTTPSSASATRR